jgi:hypothetical protein
MPASAPSPMPSEPKIPVVQEIPPEIDANSFPLFLQEIFPDIPFSEISRTLEEVGHDFLTSIEALLELQREKEGGSPSSSGVSFPSSVIYANSEISSSELSESLAFLCEVFPDLSYGTYI